MRKTIFALSIMICACVGFALGIRSQSSGGYTLKNPIIMSEEETAEATGKGGVIGNILTEGIAEIQDAAASVISVIIPQDKTDPEPISDAVATTTDNGESGSVSATYPNENIMGHLIVGKYSVMVRSDVREETLKISPGWVPESAKPGQNGMCIIYGHRNRNHLKLLENVEIGDTISFRYLDNSLVSYIVEDIQIFEHTADWTLPDVEGDVLVIATCYPFHYTGNAPGKYQVVCRVE